MEKLGCVCGNSDGPNDLEPCIYTPEEEQVHQKQNNLTVVITSGQYSFTTLQSTFIGVHTSVYIEAV